MSTECNEGGHDWRPVKASLLVRPQQGRQGTKLNACAQNHGNAETVAATTAKPEKCGLHFVAPYVAQNGIAIPSGLLFLR